jgi:hypothetical protein
VALPIGCLNYSIDAAEHRYQERATAITVSKDELAGVAKGEGVSAEHFIVCR